MLLKYKCINSKENDGLVADYKWVAYVRDAFNIYKVGKLKMSDEQIL